MKKILIIFNLALLCVSCSYYKEYWENGICRPKNPNFKIRQTHLIATNKLNFKHLYIVDNYTNALGFGFYPDGRLIEVVSNDSFTLKKRDVFGKTWNNARFIGYWRVENNKIKIQTFQCGENFGYISKNGKIKKGTP